MYHLLGLLTTEPHDEHHFGGDFMISEEVEHEGEGEDIHSPTNKNKNLWQENTST